MCFLPQERLSGHGSLGLSSSSAAYTTHSGGHTGRSGPATGHSGHSSTHGSAATMHHQSLQSDFQPPYFPPPFHHSTQSPPQQQVRLYPVNRFNYTQALSRYPATCRTTVPSSTWVRTRTASPFPRCTMPHCTTTISWRGCGRRRINWVFTGPTERLSYRDML